MVTNAEGLDAAVECAGVGVAATDRRSRCAETANAAFVAVANYAIRTIRIGPATGGSVADPVLAGPTVGVADGAVGDRWIEAETKGLDALIGRAAISVHTEH